MIIAVHLRTESGDSYLFLEEVTNEAEMLEEIEMVMDEELGCVYHWDIETIGVKTGVMEQLLRKRINQLQDEDGGY